MRIEPTFTPAEHAAGQRVLLVSWAVLAFAALCLGVWAY